jgi:hypothetical protein
MLPEAISVLMTIVDVFERKQIPYLVGGSIASAIHGISRATMDADVVAELHLDQVDAFVEELKDGFYIDNEMIRSAIHHQSCFNIIHLETIFKVDIFIRKDRPFDVNQFQRREERVISTDPEFKIFITSAEDIILTKLEWFRLGGEVSDRQWQDILGVLKFQADKLDSEYLKHWSSELKIGDLLTKALEECK